MNTCTTHTLIVKQFEMITLFSVPLSQSPFNPLPPPPKINYKGHVIDAMSMFGLECNGLLTWDFKDDTKVILLQHSSWITTKSLLMCKIT